MGVKWHPGSVKSNLNLDFVILNFYRWVLECFIS